MKTDERIASRLEVREGVKNNEFAYTSVCLLESHNCQSICGLFVVYVLEQMSGKCPGLVLLSSSLLASSLKGGCSHTNLFKVMRCLSLEVVQTR